MGVLVFPVFREWRPTRCRCGKCGRVTGPLWIRIVAGAFVCPLCNGEDATPAQED